MQIAFGNFWGQFPDIVLSTDKKVSIATLYHQRLEGVHDFGDIVVSGGVFLRKDDVKKFSCFLLFRCE